MLFTIFFLQLPGSKYYVNCATTEAALRFRQDKINQVLEKKGEHDISKQFACSRDNGNATTVAIFCSVTILLVHKNNVGIFPFMWKTFSGPAVKDKIMLPSVYSTSAILDYLSRDVAMTSCFVVFETENGLFHFVKGWWVIKYWDDRQCR